MNIPDITTMLINLSNSLVNVIYLIKGLAYLIGLTFVFIAITRFKKIAERHAQYPSQERAFVPLAYLVVGAMLILLPSTVEVFSTTMFGDNNILAYTDPKNARTLNQAIFILIKTAGFIWVVRGAVLIATASQPGTQLGAKGVVFFFAGIAALNVEGSMAVVQSIINGISHLFTVTK